MLNQTPSPRHDVDADSTWRWNLNNPIRIFPIRNRKVDWDEETPMTSRNKLPSVTHKIWGISKVRPKSTRCKSNNWRPSNTRNTSTKRIHYHALMCQCVRLIWKTRSSTSPKLGSKNICGHFWYNGFIGNHVSFPKNDSSTWTHRGVTTSKQVHVSQIWNFSSQENDSSNNKSW